MSRLITGDMSVFSVGGTNLLALAKNVTLMTDLTTEEHSPLNRIGEAETPVRQTGRVEFTSASLHATAPYRVSNLDVGAFAIGGTDYLAYLRGGSVSATHRIKSLPGVADRWDLPIVMKKRFEADITLALPTVASALIATIPFGSLAAMLQTFSITINGVVIAFPGLLKSFEHSFDNGAEQLYKAKIAGESPDVGAFPTTPVTTTTILEKCLNDPRTPLAFSITSHATEGMDYDGTLVAASYGFSFNDAAIVEERYSMLTVGAPTGVAN